VRTTASIPAPPVETYICTAISEAEIVCRGLESHNNGDPIDDHLEDHDDDINPESDIVSRSDWLYHSDSEDDCSHLYPEDSPETLDDVVDDITAHLQCLSDLSSALEFPAKDPNPVEKVAILSQIQSMAPHQYHSMLIGERFGEANREIVFTLGQANWVRFKRIRALHKGDDGGEMTDRQDTASVSEFQDSGMGTSLPATEYAASSLFKSSAIKYQSSARSPQMPLSAQEGVPFECSGCGKKVRMQSHQQWM
jgi:hypothetical protein